MQVDHKLLKLLSTDSTGVIYVSNAGMLDDVKNIIVDNDILTTHIVPSLNKPVFDIGKFNYFVIFTDWLLRQGV